MREDMPARWVRRSTCLGGCRDRDMVRARARVRVRVRARARVRVTSSTRLKQET